MAIIQDKVKGENGDEVTIYIEVDETTAPGYRGGGAKVVSDKVQESFSKAMGLIHTCAEQVSQSIKSIPSEYEPREVEVQFSVKINAEVGAVIAKTQTEAQFQVTLKWGKEG